MDRVVIVIHGGAWGIPDYLDKASLDGVKEAAKRGYAVLCSGGTAVDAVEAAVVSMEDDPVFDAGTGSVLNRNGEVEMDAFIMDGNNLNIGAVAAVQNIANPIKLARLVMDKTEHCLLVGKGANEFASEMSMPVVSTDQLVTKEAKAEFEELMKFKSTIQKRFSFGDIKRTLNSGHDTVGAVAVDMYGNIACATSTGGITAKQPGRVGDSPLVGSGGYANNKTAVSTTGHGEAIMKVCLAHRIVVDVEQGTTCQKSVEKALDVMANDTKGSGGAICVNKDGEVGHFFTTEKMPWVVIKNSAIKYGINPGECITQTL